MPDITLTQSNLHELSGSPLGHGFTSEQLKLLGFAVPPPKGWLKNLVGSTISEERYQEVKAAYKVRAGRQEPRQVPSIGLTARDTIKREIYSIVEVEECDRHTKRIIWGQTMVLMHLAGIEATEEERGLFL